MKIAYVALGFPPEIGGSETFNVEYARRLHARGHDVRVFTWQTPLPGAAESDAALPFEVRRAPFAKRRKRIDPAGLADALDAWGSEVAYVARGSRMLRDVVRLAARRLPTVVAIHEFRERHRGRGAFGRWRVRRRYGLDRAAAVTVLGADVRERMRDLGVAERRLAVVPAGVDLERFRPDPAAGDALRGAHGWQSRTLLLTVARLAANKGHAFVIDAVARLRERFPDLLYVVVGGGGRREALEAQARGLGVAEHVHFAGLVDDTLPWYQACDVFCMPSTPPSAGSNAGEGFGIAYVEAGACGKPVLAGASGGGSEVVVDGQTGRVVDPRDAAALDAALAELLGDEARRRALGEAARKHVERYDWKRGAEALEKVLKEASA